ncbi:MAG: hypothetical protein RIQ81_683 [Pseudomonadota bacterium]
MIGTETTESKQAGGESPGFLMSCIVQLEAIVEDRSLLADLDETTRTRLVKAAGMIARPDRVAIKQLSRAFRRRDRQTAKEEKAEARAASIAAKSATGLRQARTSQVFVAPEKTLPADTGQSYQPMRLAKPQACYVCKSSYQELHFFYDSMCPSCGDFNYQKRFQTADCRGRIALVTGSRVKIGYHAALMLLRAGATVIVTTRFPHDAALRYRREKDFSEWKTRLHIYGLDLRHAPSVELFAQHLCDRFQTLDFLINNAAQTVRKPRGFYDHMMKTEETLPEDPEVLSLLAGFHEVRTRIEQNLAANDAPAIPGTGPQQNAGRGLLAYATGTGNTPAPGLYASARMSQVPLLPDDLSCGSDVFPPGELDADLQQVDLRTNNSWRMRLADVSTAEMLEIQLINAVAPFILNSRLKALMLRPDETGEVRRDKHIVNVSAMEGKFTRYTKTDKHPHTNMAKAALNMMTQTSAPDYVRDGIHMNAVDTGWVTDEDPAQHAQRKRNELGFEPPLDIVDGAARIIDPVFHGLNTNEHLWGKFLKDYRSTAW